VARFELEQNMDEVKIGMDPVPANEYTLQIQENPVIKSNKKEDGMVLKVRFHIIDDPDYQGRLIFHDMSLKSTALGMPTGLKAFLIASDMYMDPSGFATEDLIGSQCRAMVGQQPGQNPDPPMGDGKPNGKIYNKIQYFIGVPGSDPNQPKE